MRNPAVKSFWNLNASRTGLYRRPIAPFGNWAARWCVGKKTAASRARNPAPPATNNRPIFLKKGVPRSATARGRFSEPKGSRGNSGDPSMESGAWRSPIIGYRTNHGIGPTPGVGIPGDGALVRLRGTGGEPPRRGSFAPGRVPPFPRTAISKRLISLVG